MFALLSRDASKEFLRFLVAGAAGFAVDYGMLLAFTGALHWPPLMARVGSVALAISSTWLINRMWTFRPAAGETRARDIAREALGYGAVQLTGAAANFLIYASLVAILGSKPLNLLAALVAGSCAALAINYFGARRFVFARSE